MAVRLSLMYSGRFGKELIVTNHARSRMAERSISDALVLDIVETGQVDWVDEGHLFVYKVIQGRRDNLICVAAVEEDRLVIKTVMVNWTRRAAI